MPRNAIRYFINGCRLWCLAVFLLAPLLMGTGGCVWHGWGRGDDRGHDQYYRREDDHSYDHQDEQH